MQMSLKNFVEQQYVYRMQLRSAENVNHIMYITNKY
jgi:hypothetical protein